MIIHRDIIQGSEQWHRIRQGRPTASCFDRIITAKEGKLSKSCDGYIAELIAECFMDPEEMEPRLPSYWETRGLEMEPKGREAFSKLTRLKLELVGFVTREDRVGDKVVEIVGCSPDALVTDEHDVVISGLELKCPMPKTHVQYVMQGTLPDEYRQQVHGSMAITGLDEWHFFSYHDAFRPLHLVIPRDEYTEKVSVALDEFIVRYQEARQRVIPQLKL